MRNIRPRIDWSNLPVEIVRSIATHLQEDIDDLRRFRLTCKKWRRSTAISTILPLPINSTPRKKLYFSKTLLLRPLGCRSAPSSSYSPWMVSAVETTKGDIQFCHPFSKAPLLSWSLTDGSFDFDRFRSTELAVAYHVTLSNNDEESVHREFDKVLMTSSHSLPSADYCGLLALHDGGRLGGYLSFNNNQDEEDGDELELPWIEVKHGSICRFDDIIMYKGMIIVVDRQGKVHTINGKTFEAVDTLVGRPLSPSRTRARGCRRRFVLSPSRKLYLVEMTSQRLVKVYKLYEEIKSGTMWVEVKTFGDRVMFVTRDYCFFTPASEFYTCNLNNCIVFSNDAFPKYGRTGWELPDPTKSGADISVFRLGGCSEYNFKPISKFTGFPLLLWSCPPWAWNVGSSPCQCHGQQSQHQRETEENEEIQSDANSQDDASPVSFDSEPVENISEATSTSTTRLETATVMMPSSFESELAEKTTEMPSTPATKERATIVETPSAVVPQLAELITTEMPSTSATPERVTSAETPSAVIPEQMHEVPITSAATMTKSNTPDLAKQVSVKASVSAAQEGATTLTNEVEPVAEEAFHMETLREEIINQSGSRANIQSNKTDTSTVTFEGLEIRSNLLPTLQNVWSKHGNLMENITIRNVDIVSKALESLATAVLILEENSARSLSDSQADYLSSTLSDLGCMKFKVDWLVPYVEKAAMLHNSKPYMDSLDIIDKCKAQIEERKSKLLEELAHLDKVVDELDEDVARVSKEIPICISENVDLDKPLGGVLS